MAPIRRHGANDLRNGWMMLTRLKGFGFSERSAQEKKERNVQTADEERNAPAPEIDLPARAPTPNRPPEGTPPSPPPAGWLTAN
jgi:hypothetical protein